MRTWENFIKTELKKYISYSKDDIIILSTIRELKRVFTEDNYEISIWNF